MQHWTEYESLSHSFPRTFQIACSMPPANNRVSQVPDHINAAFLEKQGAKIYDDMLGETGLEPDDAATALAAAPPPAEKVAAVTTQ